MGVPTSLRSNEGLARATIGGGLLVGLILALLSDGAYQDDDICHFLFARDAWGSAHAMLHWWARPGYNIPAMVAAQFGLFGVRVLSLLQTTAVAWLSWRIARRVLGDVREAALAPLLVWLQPLVFTLSLTTLTETPAALYLTAAVALALAERPIWACASLSLLFVTRYETLGLGALFGLYLLWQRYHEIGLGALWSGRLWACAAAMLWAPAMYVLGAFLLDLPAGSSPIYMFSREYTSEYGSGPWYHMVARWPQAAGVGICGLTVAGAVWLGRRGGLVSLLAFGMLGLQGLIFSVGSFASGGYARFLVPVCGLVAVLAAGGVRAIATLRERRITIIALLSIGAWPLVIAYRFEAVAHWMGWLFVPLALFCGWAVMVHRSERDWSVRGAAAIIGLVVVGQFVAQVRPLTIAREPHHQLMADAVAEIAADTPVLTQHIMVTYWRGDVTILAGNGAALERWTAAEPGTVYLWENKYSLKSHEPESTARLRAALERLGARTWSRERGSAHAEIWIRGPIPVPGAR